MRWNIFAIHCAPKQNDVYLEIKRCQKDSTFLEQSRRALFWVQDNHGISLLLNCEAVTGMGGIWYIRGSSEKATDPEKQEDS